MDTDRLRYYCTIARTGNLHRAAELLHVSPAALSKAIKVLEGEVKFKLMIPSGRGIAITDEGKLFATKAEKLLVDFENLKGGKHKEPQQEVLRVCSFEVFTTHALSEVLKNELSDLALELHELVPGKIEDSISNRIADVGITYIPIPRGDVDFLKVANLKMGVYGIKGPLLKAPLQEVRFVAPVTPVEGSPTKVVGLDGWPDDQFPRNIFYKVTMMESAFELCRMGKALGFFPQFVVDLHNSKVKDAFQFHPYQGEIPLKSQYLEQPVYLIKRKTDLEDKRIKQLAKALRLMLNS